MNILESIKKQLGIEPDDLSFDEELLFHINSVFNIITQLGIGPEEGFELISGKEEWNEFLDNPKKLNMIKSYIYMKVKLMFDPPTTGTHIESMERLVKELESRLNYEE